MPGDSLPPVVLLLRGAHIAATGIEGVSLQMEGRLWTTHRRRPSPFFGTKTLPPPMLEVNPAKGRGDSGRLIAAGHPPSSRGTHFHHRR